jgi:plastocyanin
MSLRSKPHALAAPVGSAFATMVFMVAVSISPAFPQGTLGASGPFDALAGLWSGSGVVETSDGLHERVRCKATYVPQNGGHHVQLDLRCASDAYKFELSSTIVQTGDALSGNWFESTHRVGGSISGRNNGHEIDARAEGDTFTALLTVKTNGRRQLFLMESPGAKVSQVSINLSQASK